MLRAARYGALLAGLALGACQDPPNKSGPSASSSPRNEPNDSSTRREGLTSAKPALPAGPPSLVIDNIGPKVGFERALLNFPEGRKKLSEALTQSRAHFQNQTPTLSVERKVSAAWVSTFLSELSKIDVSKVSVQTPTRSEFSGQVVFTPEARVNKPPACSPTVMILADRSTAVWKLGGGVAGRRPKGMAGPDLSMTADTIERVAKACKNSGWLFVAAAPEVEWGLLFDLAASTKAIPAARFESIVLVSTTPVPGHPVQLVE